MRFKIHLPNAKILFYSEYSKKRWEMHPKICVHPWNLWEIKYSCINS